MRQIGCTGFPVDSHDTIWITGSIEREHTRCPECGNGKSLAANERPAFAHGFDHCTSLQTATRQPPGNRQCFTYSSPPLGDGSPLRTATRYTPGHLLMLSATTVASWEYLMSLYQNNNIPAPRPPMSDTDYCSVIPDSPTPVKSGGCFRTWELHCNPDARA